MNVAHILPSLDIGGVEVGIQKSLNGLQNSFDYKVFYVKKKGRLNVGQKHVLYLILGIVTRRWCPDVIITSLWYAHPIGWMFSMIGIKWYAFYHLADFAHSLDALVLNFSWKNADFRLCDSQATSDFMNKIQTQQSHVIPYVFKNFANSSALNWQSRNYDVVWVGRNHPQKRIDILCSLIGCIIERKPDLKVLIILAGDESELLNQLCSLYDKNITIVKNIENSKVIEHLHKSKCYVLTSDVEGMSLSTIEAIQAGCLPVVRPVGEIKNYLSEDACVRIYETDVQSLINIADRTICLLSDAIEANLIITNAVGSIERIGFYTEQLTAAIKMRGVDEGT